MPDYTGTIPAAPIPPQHLPQTTPDNWYAALAAFNDAFTSTWTPVWTATGTAPAKGNGFLYGTYLRIGKLIIATADMLAGSTTTFGTGTWSFSLPVTANASVNSGLYCGALLLWDSSPATNRISGVTILPTTTTMSFIASTGNMVGSTVPFPWVSGDHLGCTVIYEAA